MSEDIAWKLYIDMLFRAHEKEHGLLSSALSKAEDILNLRFQGHESEHKLLSANLDKAEKVLEIRLEGMNEFRRQLDKQSDSFVTKDMLRPLEAFQNKFYGVMIGASILNGVITALICMLLRRG